MESTFKKKNNDLESLVLIQKEQIQKLNDDNEQLKTHNSKLIDDNNFFSSRYNTYFHLYYNLQEYNTLNSIYSSIKQQILFQLEENIYLKLDHTTKQLQLDTFNKINDEVSDIVIYEVIIFNKVLNDTAIKCVFPASIFSL